MLFACAGYQVSLYDELDEQVDRARDEIHAKLAALRDQGLARGSLTLEQQAARVAGQHDLQECVRDAIFIQECVPENLEMKKSVWKKIDSLDIKDDVILSSSASAIVPSKISEELAHRSRFVVSHPTNPPFYCPLLEIIPAPWTDPGVVVKTKSLMQELGQDPVILNKEINGFVLNRIQYAIFGECYRLVEDGIISVQDCDKVMSSGLGTRYAFMGPFETGYLNAEGFESYCDRYRDMIYKLQTELGSPRLMGGDTMRRIHEDVGNMFGSVENIGQRRQWRDDRLAALAKLKKDADKQN
ncbi:lambda-crystallin homolog isoform X2 [Gigantopelta aegis]|nr:lambda-crystallin homolog isoform X2 [Gigantopelta aegis]